MFQKMDKKFYHYTTGLLPFCHEILGIALVEY